jgi:hypothetical protein
MLSGKQKKDYAAESAVEALTAQADAMTAEPAFGAADSDDDDEEVAV